MFKTYQTRMKPQEASCWKMKLIHRYAYYSGNPPYRQRKYKARHQCVRICPFCGHIRWITVALMRILTIWNSFTIRHQSFSRWGLFFYVIFCLPLPLDLKSCHVCSSFNVKLFVFSLEILSENGSIMNRTTLSWKNVSLLCLELQ